MSRSLVLIWVSLILLIAALYIVLHIFVVRSFVELERRDALENVDRLLNAIAERRMYINSKASDWAAWDDAYQFVQDHNSHFIRSNIVLSAFTGIHLNLIAYIDKSGEIAYARWYEPEANKLIPIPASAREAIYGSGVLINHRNVHDSVSGIIMLKQGPMLVASRPVVTSNEEGPIRGSLIFGRLLTDGEAQSLSQVIGMPTTIRSINHNNLTGDFARARSRIVRSGQMIVQPRSNAVVAGYTMLDDISGDPALMLRVEMPRTIYNQGLAVTSYSVVALIILSMLFGLIDSFLIVRATRKEREFDKRTRDFYRQTVTAATDGKLIMADLSEIDDLCATPVAHWEVRLPTDLTEVRNTAHETALSAGFDEERAWKFATSTGEAVTNAIKHAGGGKARLCRSPEGLLFFVSDHGGGIPTLALPDVALRRGYSTAGTLGMGYKIMISFADRVYLATGPKGTTAAIAMNLKPEDSPVADMAWLGALSGSDVAQ